MPGFKTTLVDLLARADRNMYRNKQKSKDDKPAHGGFAASPDTAAAKMAEDIWTF